MDRYVVAGNPVEHSQSPFIHAEFAKMTGQSMEYGRLLVPIDGFAEAVAALRRELKVPHTLPELIQGLEMDGARRSLIADMAVVDPTAGGNPVELTKEAALAILDSAIEGRL